MSDKTPALFVPVLQNWITEAFEYFESGKEKLYFYTDSNIGQAEALPIKRVYFKPKGTVEVFYVADFIGLSKDNPRMFRLSGSESKEGKYYYGYTNLRELGNSIPVEELVYFVTGTFLKSSTPGACIIVDPLAET